MLFVLVTERFRRTRLDEVDDALELVSWHYLRCFWLAVPNHSPLRRQNDSAAPQIPRMIETLEL